jgi:glycosyltransferase involved in cell wall biosynthesis
MTAPDPGRKRIAMYYNMGFGGGRRWLYEITSRLDKYHDVDFYCINRASLGKQFPDGTDVAQRSTIRDISDIPKFSGKLAKVLNLPASWIDFIRFDRAARAMAREIDAKGYDAVLASIGDYTYAPLILRHLRTTSVYYCHEPMRTAYEPEVPRDYVRAGGSSTGVLWRFWRWISADYAGLRMRWDAQATRRASLVIVNSEYTQDYARRAYGVSAVVNHPGVDILAFRPGVEARQRFVLAGPGAILRSKGYDWSIRAIATIPARRRPKLVIAGNASFAPERAYLETIARQLDVTLDIVEGIADIELKRLLRTAPVMLYTPHLEPFGLAVVEAMASGTSVVAVREAGPTETVVDGVTGFLCDRDPGQLGDAVVRLLDDAELRDRMGRAARQHAVENWTWDRAVGQLQGLLVDAVDHARASTENAAAGERSEGTELTVARRQT